MGFRELWSLNAQYPNSNNKSQSNEFDLPFPFATGEVYS